MGAGKQTVLVTGSAGFIGFHLCQSLLQKGYQVIGLDGLSDYYDVSLKKRRHEILETSPDFTPVIGLLETDGLLADLLATHQPSHVVHLAAQAGVRWSIENPRAYLNANLIGTFNLLEAVRATPCAHLLLASTSSAYGANTQMPYRETDRADHQMSFYAATKKSNEAMAHSYAHLYAQPATMFRFFTVYGPWGRPDMALFKFTRAILQGAPIDIYNRGQMKRDFTYIDDLIDALVALLDTPPTGPAVEGDSLSPVAPFRVVNIGNSTPVPLMEFVAAIEEATGRKAIKNMMEMQPGDVPHTWADTTLVQNLTGVKPATSVKHGVQQFVDWYRDYYEV